MRSILILSLELVTYAVTCDLIIVLILKNKFVIEARVLIYLCLLDKV
jgi:hypothetical protein